MTEQYQCQSYSDDDRNVQDCTCGKCGNASDTEMGKAELAVFWDEIAQHLPKSIERSALGDEKIFDAFATAYPNMRQHLITSRDTYWKEKIEELELSCVDDRLLGKTDDYLDGYNTSTERWREQRDALLDNLK